MTIVSGNPASESTPTRRGDLTVYEWENEALIFHPTSRESHQLNSTALFIWRMCDGRHERGRIAEALTRHYEVDLDSARKHVDRILDEMREHQLINVGRGAIGMGREGN